MTNVLRSCFAGEESRNAASRPSSPAYLVGEGTPTRRALLTPTPQQDIKWSGATAPGCSSQTAPSFDVFRLGPKG